MTTEQHPLEVYRRFQSYLLRGEFARLGEVADMDGYTENCVGLTGWTTGLQIALRNFQENIASQLTDMAVTEHDVLEAGDMLVIRGTFEVTHSGEFLVSGSGDSTIRLWDVRYRKERTTLPHGNGSVSFSVNVKP